MVSADGDLLAHYEYDPFGKTIVSSGSLAQTNPFRFSTKYWDDVTGLGNWGYRWYSPEMGRWMSRDPAEERVRTNYMNYKYSGGEYLMIGNAPGDDVDAFGLMSAAEDAALRQYLLNQVKAGLVIGLLDTAARIYFCCQLEPGESFEINAPSTVMASVAFGWYGNVIFKLKITKWYKTWWDCDYEWILISLDPAPLITEI